MAASINLIGQLVVTDLNGGNHIVNLSNAYPGGGTPYTVDSWQTFSIAAGATTTIFDVTSGGDVLPVSPWTVMVLLPSITLACAYGIDASAAGGLTATSVWNNVPLAANQLFAVWKNAFFYNYVAEAAANNVFGGTATGVLLKMQVKELTGTTAGNIQVITIT